MNNFLLEILCEEIPAELQSYASKELLYTFLKEGFKKGITTELYKEIESAEIELKLLDEENAKHHKFLRFLKEKYGVDKIVNIWLKTLNLDRLSISMKNSWEIEIKKGLTAFFQKNYKDFKTLEEYVKEWKIIIHELVRINESISKLC